MVLRLSHPKQPTRLVDLGPASGLLHDFREMRRTIDDLRPSRLVHHFRTEPLVTIEVRVDAR